MGLEYIGALSVLVSLICFSISIFQLLLALGLPLGDYAWGGKYKVLPTKLRISSVLSFLILNFIGMICLQNTNIINIPIEFLNNKIFIWIFAVFFGINTIGNLFSTSKKEKIIMTPLTITVTVALILIVIKL